MAYILSLTKIFDEPKAPGRAYPEKYTIVDLRDISEITNQFGLTKEFHDWMKKNIKGGWIRMGRTFYANDGDFETFLFTQKDSAMLFKMRWSYPT